MRKYEHYHRKLGERGKKNFGNHSVLIKALAIIMEREKRITLTRAKRERKKNIERGGG